MEIIAFICFGISFFKRSEWFWAFAIIMFAILTFSSYDIIQNVNIVTNQTMNGSVITYSNEIMSKSNSDLSMFYLNFTFAIISLILFIADLFFNSARNKLGERYAK